MKRVLYSLAALLICGLPALGAPTQEAVVSHGDSAVAEPIGFEIPAASLDLPAETSHPALPTEAPEAPRQVTTLPGVPSALLMTVVGCLCVGLVRGRRRWFALVVAVCSVCQAGLGSLPKLAAALSGRQSVELTSAGSAHPERYRLHVTGATSDIEYVGLLRRLGSEPADSVLEVTEVASTPAVGAFSRRSTAGSFVEPVDSPVALFPNGAAIRPDASCAVLPRRATSVPSSKTTPYALFARPPPAASS